MHNILQQALAVTLDQLTSAVILVMDDGRILHVNKSGHELFAEGRFFRSHNGFLLCRDKATTENLLRTLKQLSGETVYGMAMTNPLEISLSSGSDYKDALTLSIKHLDDANSVQKKSNVFALFAMQRGAPADKTLAGIAQLFSLTPAETRTLECFVEGVSVAEAAQNLKISENTVKTHLQNIFAKTGTSRQTHLLKLINDLKAPLRPEDEQKLSSFDNNRAHAGASRLAVIA